MEHHLTIAHALQLGIATLHDQARISHQQFDEKCCPAQSPDRRDRQTATLEAEILLAHCLEKNRAYLRTWPEKSLSRETAAQFQQLLARRQRGEPIAYIIGFKEFWSLHLRVTPQVLIPRAETEHLVELALARIPATAQWQIADLGTGSGAIALAIAKERPRCQLIATDIAAASLEIAKHNAEINQIYNVSFHVGSWFIPLAKKNFQMVIANPPYVAEHDPHLQRGDLRFEPARALSSGADGLKDIQHIVSQVGKYLIDPGWLLLEHGYRQGAAVAALLAQSGFRDVQCYSDFAQLERVTLGRYFA